MPNFPPTSQQLARAARAGDLGLSTALVGAAGLWFCAAWACWRAPSWGQMMAHLWTEGLRRQDPHTLPILSALALELCTGLGCVWATEWLADAVQAPAHLLTSAHTAPQRGRWLRGFLSGGASALLVALWLTRNWTQGGLPWTASQDVLGFGLAAGLFIAVLDAGLMKWLRWRALHMTRDAFMRDQRESEMNPELRRAIRPETPAEDQSPQNPLLAEASQDLDRVVLALTDAEHHLCACLTYDPPLLDPPHLGIITDTQPATKTLMDALLARQVPLIHDPALLRDVRANTRLGAPLPETLYDRVIFWLRMFPNKLPQAR